MDIVLTNNLSPFYIWQKSYSIAIIILIFEQYGIPKVR